MDKSDLEGAVLASANLKEAKLLSADMRGADLQGAELWKADLLQTNLYGANLRRAEAITPAQLKTASNWKCAFYSGEFLADIQLPSDHNEELAKYLKESQEREGVNNDERQCCTMYEPNTCKSETLEPVSEDVKTVAP